MHVICSEIHESARIDRQLIGRCGRQGDPGSFRLYMALDDEILKQGFGKKKAARLVKMGKRSNGKDMRHLARIFFAAQTRVERESFKGRKLLLYHDKQRRKTQLQMGLDPYLDTIE